MGYKKALLPVFLKQIPTGRSARPTCHSWLRYANDSSVRLKTDDNDPEAIFHAAVNGYGLVILPQSMPGNADLFEDDKLYANYLPPMLASIFF